MAVLFVYSFIFLNESLLLFFLMQEFITKYTIIGIKKQKGKRKFYNKNHFLYHYLILKLFSFLYYSN